MSRVDLLVHAPHFYTMEGDGVGYQANTAMAVDRGRIAAIGPAEEIMPGFAAERVIHAS